MKRKHIALITVALGLCLAAIPQWFAARKSTQSWTAPVSQQTVTTASGVNPYQDAIDNQYQMTDESLGSIDETYGQPEPEVKPPKNVNNTIEVTWRLNPNRCNLRLDSE